MMNFHMCPVFSIFKMHFFNILLNRVATDNFCKVAAVASPQWACLWATNPRVKKGRTERHTKLMSLGHQVYPINIKL